MNKTLNLEGDELQLGKNTSGPTPVSQNSQTKVSAGTKIEQMKVGKTSPGLFLFLTVLSNLPVFIKGANNFETTRENALSNG